MTQLTKEYFDRQLEKLVTKKDLDEKLAQQTKQLKAYTDQQTEELARMVSRAFDEHNRYLKEEFAAIRKELDVRKEVDGLKLQVQEIRHALNLEES